MQHNSLSSVKRGVRASAMLSIKEEDGKAFKPGVTARTTGACFHDILLASQKMRTPRRREEEAASTASHMKQR